VRIPSHDQGDFLGPRPSFQLLLAGKGSVYIIVGFPVQQTDNVVTVRESLKMMEFMLENPTVEVATDFNV
jgi:hypothetical protein